MITVSNSEIRKARQLHEKRMVKGLTLLNYFLKPGDTSETQDMSSETPPANATDRQHNGGAHVEDSPEMNKNSEANVNYEDYLEMVLNVENGIEDMDKSRKKKKRKSKQQKESQADENDDTVIAETEENDEEGISKKKKRRRSKKHGSIAEENEESNTGDVVNKDNDVDEVDGEVAVKKKKKKHKKHKKDEEEVEEEEAEEILQNDADVKLERSMDVGDGDYAVSSDDASKGNNKMKERQKKEKEENEKSKFLISRNREQTWPKEDVLRLLVSLQNNLSDTTKIKTEELWERVQFDSYTPEDCKAMYTAAVAKVRKIRTMLEIVKDAIRILPTLNTSKTKAITKPKPMTPLKLYIDSHYKKAFKKFPHLRQIEILNLITKQWVTLDDKKKMKYIMQAVDWEKKYLDEAEEYKKLHPEFTAKPFFTKLEQKMLLRRTGLPEKPCCNGFGLFIKMSSHLLVDVKGTNRMKGLSKIFNELPAAVKEDYENRSKMERIEYQEKVSEYVSKLSPEECLSSVNTKLVEEQLKLEKKNQPASAFLLYYSENKDSLPGLDKAEKYKALQERWKMLPKASQQSYKKQRKAMQKSLNSRTNKMRTVSTPAAATTT